MEFLWEAKGHEALIAGAHNARETVLLHLDRALRKVNKLLLPQLREVTPLGATHKLHNVTRGQVLGSAENMRLEIRQGAKSPGGYFYGIAVREGTRPHWPPSSQTGKFVSVLIPWINAVLGIQGKKANSVAFLIGRKISIFGTKPNRYHQRVLEANMGRIQEIVDDEGVSITGKLSGKGD